MHVTFSVLLVGRFFFLFSCLFFVIVKSRYVTKERKKRTSKRESQGIHSGRLSRSTHTPQLVLLVLSFSFSFFFGLISFVFVFFFPPVCLLFFCLFVGVFQLRFTLCYFLFFLIKSFFLFCQSKCSANDALYATKHAKGER